MKSGGSIPSKRHHVSPSTDDSDAENVDPIQVEELLADSLTSQRKHQKEMMDGFKAANEIHAANSRALIELLDRKL